VGSSNVWVMKAALPRNARLDYKIVLNGREWLPDPDNPHQQWGGGGPNSELRMPDWKPEPLTIRRNSVAKGTFSESQLMFSHQLGYDILYKVYVPAGYEHLDNLPTIYVTDGQEYVDERLGAMINVLDNLIADKKIKPIIAVFIDPREVKDPSNNRRMIELPLNDHFLEFVRDELVPHIDKSYRTNPSPDARAIMGTSLGGLNAAFFGLKAPDTFRLIGIHSPAFWYRPKIYEMYNESPQLPLKIFMTTGVMSDTEEGARQMKSILEKKNYNFQYLEVNEGHSWGNWRALIDDILVYFFQ
jgi:enterochelin esterase-like enzyme